MGTLSWPVRLSTTGPLAAGATLWRLAGRPHLTVIVKASFAAVAEGDARLVAPDPLCAGDLAPYLPAVDVLVVGAEAGAHPGAARRIQVAGEHSLVDKAAPPGAPPSIFGPDPSPDRALLAAPGVELPQGFDWSVMHAAPADQRVPSLQGIEWVVLEGLAPAHPVLRTRLPDVGASAQVLGLGAPVYVKLRLDTLVVDLAASRVDLLWRGFLALPREVSPGELAATAGVFVQGREVQGHEASAPEAIDLEGTIPLTSNAPTARAHLPFAGRPAAPPAPGSAPRAAVPGAPWSAEKAPRAVSPAAFDGTMDLTSAKDARVEVDLEGTVAPVGGRPTGSALPFPAGAPRAPGSSPSIPVAGAPWARGAVSRPPSLGDFIGTMNLTEAVAQMRAVPVPPGSAPGLAAAPPVEEKPPAPSEAPPVEPARVAAAPVDDGGRAPQTPRKEGSGLPAVGPTFEAPRVEPARVHADPPRVERADPPPSPPQPPPRPATAPRKSATGTLYTGFGKKK